MNMRLASVLLSAVLMTFAIASAQAQSTLLNTGFEAPSIVAGAVAGATPDSWFFFATSEDDPVGITDAKRHDGLQACRFKCHKLENGVKGLAQKFAAAPGFRYEFSIHVIGDASDAMIGESYAQISLEWQDAAGKELERVYGPTWNFELSPIRWEKLLVGADAPEGTASGTAVVTFFTRDANGAGTFYADDAKLVQKAGAAKE